MRQFKCYNPFGKQASDPNSELRHWSKKSLLKVDVKKLRNQKKTTNKS